MVKATELLKKNLATSIAVKRELLDSENQQIIFDQAANLIAKRYKSGGRLYIAGNGGSAADAQHLAAEFVCRLSKDRASLPAESLVVDSYVLTAIGNDYGFEHVFARQVEGKMTPKDVFLGITTSGKSLNILRALDMCKKMGIPTVVFSGGNGGHARDRADFCVVAPGDLTSSIQELHIVLAHTLCEYVETSILGEHP